jgi:exodeoxyribonuclease VII large subunit
MPASYTLYELNEYIRRVIALNFAEPIWVSCEISQVKEVRGNVYLDLVYHDEKSQDITAQISASIWYKSYLFLKTKLGALLPSLLREGTHILVKVQVEFSERYGMKLIIEDIDPSFTIGQMEMNRQKIMQKLSDDGLIGLNKNQKMPSVVKRIAVISSATAAGFIDFQNHLQHNSYGYTYKISLYQVAMQGQNTEKDVTKAFDAIHESVDQYDCVLIIRGGGSKLDLSAFDNYNIGAKISKCNLPVLTGIGHDIDSTVADICASYSLKTPTALADYIIEHNFRFETTLTEVTHWISRMAGQLIKNKELELQQTIQILKIIPSEIIRTNQVSINYINQNINTSVKTILHRHTERLKTIDSNIHLLNPKNILKRGYSIIRQDNTVIKRSTDLDKNKDIQIEFFDKEIKVNTHE